MLQQFIDLVEVVQAVPHPHHPDELSSTALASSPNEARSKGWGQFFCSQDFRPESPLTLYHQEQRYCFLQTRYRTFSPNCCRGHTWVLSSPHGWLWCAPLAGCRVCSPVCCSWRGTGVVSSLTPVTLGPSGAMVTSRIRLLLG